MQRNQRNMQKNMQQIINNYAKKQIINMQKKKKTLQ